MMKKMWAQEKMMNDVEFKRSLENLITPAGYESSDFGSLSLYEKKRFNYARVDITLFEAKVSTTSSHWTTDEANIMMEEMQQAILLASKLNVLIREFTAKYERIFVKTDPMGQKIK